MLIGGTSEHVELTRVEVQAAVAGASAGGDVRVIARVRFGDFGGTVDAWIARDTWSTFSEQLIALERTRQGKAMLESMSPGELRLCLRSLDRQGHMGVEGELTHNLYGAGGRRPQLLQLQFDAMEFDPTLLPRLIAEIVSLPNGG